MAFVFEQQPDHKLTAEQLAVYTATLARRTPILKASRDDLSAVQDPHTVPVGSVEFVRALAARWGAEEHLLAVTLSNYPEALHGFLARKPVLTTWGTARSSLQPLFVKPGSSRDLKVFTGQVFSPADFAGRHCPDDMPVWVCAPLPPLRSEHRVYIRGGILGMGRYDDGEEEASLPDRDTINAMVAALGPSAPAGYALDVAVCARRTILIEATDGWAIGYYRGTCPAAEYAALLTARWHEIMAEIDPPGMQP